MRATVRERRGRGNESGGGRGIGGFGYSCCNRIEASSPWGRIERSWIGRLSFMPLKHPQEECYEDRNDDQASYNSRRDDDTLRY